MGAPWCWNMYQHLPQQKSPSLVGKYTSTMEHLGPIRRTLRKQVPDSSIRGDCFVERNRLIGFKHKKIQNPQPYLLGGTVPKKKLISVAGIVELNTMVIPIDPWLL